MDQQTQLAGLNKFLGTIYEGGTTLDTLLDDLGFDAPQRASLRQRHLPALASGLIETVRTRLTWEDKDLWFRIIALRLGMGGEPPVSLEAAAQALNIDPGYAAYAEGEALQKCSTKSALEDFMKELYWLGKEGEGELFQLHEARGISLYSFNHAGRVNRAADR